MLTKVWMRGHTDAQGYRTHWYKRDDLYCPWGDVNGGKVRQAEALFETEEVQDLSLIHI